MTFALTVPSAGSLENYIQSVNQFRILTQEEELQLARSLRDEGSIDAARQLVLSHLRLVVAIARGYKGYGLPQADLIQEGNIGLMKAVKRFDPERGVRLVSFAVHWIKAEIHEFILRNWRLVKIATTKAQRKLFFNLRSLKQALDTMSQKEVAEVAEQLGVKPEEVVEMETRFSGRDISLEPLSEDDDEETFSPIAYLTDGSEPSHVLEDEQTMRLRGEGLEQALESLDARSRHIIEARWLREKDTATLHELADELGVSAERVRQIEAKAMQKLRAVMAPAA
ncbi:RNA polymerase sigma factor RpoH [Nitrosospira multiformis]|uniref:RNA polymerase sigma factor RpoH n=1 Tax=Nitrosospira multiformis (strain ATCC 25196 / NCIMB 11849 / C 71) TaxID=323848 RepID=Q2Y5E3_NITMU|nr:RNA polymerase sigma factor RpoH [Nitrosospira multiformis]ABB76028.1 RNA polymerase, sigma 32 subunit, RpoH [Nitrosospira multiformis ATCC 25196]SEA46943.1 RNA polymerase, sigma 32 subunit, RpoH [Nitrosospira multiformis]SEF78323.1 RNA polymerase, sigma 32 subunit, RpoH [Nitrosospira multiformis ATCC 25196]